jgi:hypothetical protein
MGKESVFKQKKRGGLDRPTFTPLSEAMNQGGGYKNGAPESGLSKQMNQGGGYDAGQVTHGLRNQMGQ